MSKSGFEIRADLLGQAQGMLEQNIQREVDAIMYNNELTGIKKELPVCSISPKDVIATAKELYEFVNEK